MCFAHHLLLYQPALQRSSQTSGTDRSGDPTRAAQGGMPAPSDTEFTGISDLEAALADLMGADVRLQV